MIQRSADPIMVTEKQLASAIRVIERELAAAATSAKISVQSYVDPEIEECGARTLLLAKLHGDVGAQKYWALHLRVCQALRERHLLEPDIPLSYMTSDE